MGDKTVAFSEGLRNYFETHVYTHTGTHSAVVSGSW